MGSIKLSLVQSANESFGSVIFKTLMHLQKKLIIWIPFSMVLGLLYGYLFDASTLKTMVIPATFIMVYPMMVTLNIKKLFSVGGTKLLTVTQLINFIIIPLIGFAVGLVFFPNNIMVRIGFLLITLIPTSGMTIIWTSIAKGNVNEAIRMTVSGLLLGAILTPLYLKALLGTAIEIPLSKIFMQILIVVFIPMILGYLTQQLLVKNYGREYFQTKIKIKFPPVSTLGVLVIVFIAMGLKSKGILSNLTMLIKLLIPLIIMYLVIFLLSTFIGKFLFKKLDAIALVYGTAMRNLAIALAIAMSVFKTNGTEIVLVIAIAFIVQVQSAAWYTKYASKILK